MENTQYAFASYLFRVKVNTLILPETLTVFLNSKYGRIEIDKNSMKGNQTNFSPAKFKDIRIPIFNSAINKFIATIVARLSRQKNQAKLMNQILPLTSCLTTA